MIETIPGPDPSVVERILQERANALAVPPKTESAGDALSVVVVTVGPERYGIEITQIREVQPLSGLVAVPAAPSTWAGLVNLRGSLYPVLNLRVHLGLEPGPIGSDARVVVVGDERNAIALLVDGVYEVTEVSSTQLDTSMTRQGREGGGVIRGVTRDFLSVLDVVSLLTDPSLVVRDESG
jgi:purine-binding chemotaxis protein CheW